MVKKKSKGVKRDKSSGIEGPSESEEVALLTARIAEESPASGTQATSSSDLRFNAYPISRLTLKGLGGGKFTHPTDIQAAAIPHALAGRDILGAAKTGSGKTLSYVVPILERLFLERWGSEDGLGAIIIVPTRELGLQVFDVLRIAGRHHNFSAGLITGGKKEFEGEQEHVVRMNVLIATPGRLLQHFEQTPGFDANSLQMLVLDEADRLLDLGFKAQLDAILSYLPARQTLLFSATQTKSVKDLARLSLRGAEYLAVHATDEQVTPASLTQHYVVCPLADKLDTLFSFLRTHVKHKTIVFFSTCAQARFVFDVFKAMQPGVPLVALHGKIKQEKRTQIYLDFLKRPQACMFATDIAARGLDFPAVDWVVQVDAPEDSDMYIHRVGRTARYKAKGRSLLMLLPQEERAVGKELSDAGIPIKKLTINSKHTTSVASKAAALLAQNPDLRVLAKKAFTSYLRSLLLQPKRLALYVHKTSCSLNGASRSEMLLNPSLAWSAGTGLPLESFSASLGLAFIPDLPAVPKTAQDATDTAQATKKKKNINRSLDKLKAQIKADKEAKRLAREANSASKKKAEKSSSSSSSSSSTSSSDSSDDSSSDDDDLLVVKKTHRPDGESDDNSHDDDDGADGGIDPKRLRKLKQNKLKIDSDGQSKAATRNKRILFDEEGEALPGLQLREGGSGEVDEGAMLERVRRVKARIDEGRREDTEREKQRIKDKHLKQRQTREKDREGEMNDAAMVSLANAESGVSASDSDSSSDSGSGYARGKKSMDEAEESDGDSSSSSSDYDDDDDDDDDNDDDSPEAIKAREQKVLALMDRLK